MDQLSEPRLKVELSYYHMLKFTN